MAAESEFKGGVVVVTTMDTEFHAMRDRLDSWSGGWHKAGTYFVRGRMNGVPWPVILMITGTGNTGSSALSERAIDAYEPRALLVVGVAGSLRDDVRLGDVVVADWIHSYHGGKEDEDGLHARPRGGPAGHRLEQAVYASMTDPWWEPLTGDVRPRVHVKPIASGDVVLNSPGKSLGGQLDRGGLREWLRRHFNDAAAIEMESAGAIRAAQLNDGLPFLAIRGISDLADGTKHDSADTELQPMAAAHAAAFTAVFLRKLAESEATRGPGRQSDPPPSGKSQRSREPSAGRAASSRDRTSVPGLGELLFSTRIDRPAGQLLIGFGADDTLLVAEKNAAVHRWSLKDHTSELTGMPSGEPLRSGINVVASSATPAIAIARDRKLVLVHFGQDRHTTSELPLRPNEFLITAAGERFATYDGRRVAVRDFGGGSVLWEQPCPSNLATATIDQTGTAIAMASGPSMFSSSNKVTFVTQDDAAPREFSFENLRLGAGCVLGLAPKGTLVACASFREVILASPADRRVLRRRPLGGWQEVVPALGARPQRLICTPGGTVLWLRGRRITLVRWDVPGLHYLSQDGDCDDIAYDPAGSRLAIVSQSGQVDVWKLLDDDT